MQHLQTFRSMAPKTMELWAHAKKEAKSDTTEPKIQVGVMTNKLNSEKLRKRACLLKYFGNSTGQQRSTSDTDCASG